MKDVVPYKDKKETKKKQVAEMFNNISLKYDLLNHLLSFGIDVLWRKKAIKLLKPYKPKVILDVATGTGDFAIEARKLNPDKIIGIDISDGMLEVGREKLKKKGLDQLITLQNGDSENIDLEDNSIDAIIVAFGVRNFEDLEKGLSEFYRVLKPGGVAVVLEFSKPGKFPMKQLFNFYFKYILPIIGRSISKDQSAYTYLPESVQRFPEGKAFTDILENLNFKEVKWKPLTFGISAIYMGEKP